jgi:hypothetical protein
MSSATPPAPDLDGLRKLWAQVGGRDLVQVIDSEQMEKWSRLSPFALIPMSLASDDEAAASWEADSVRLGEDGGEIRTEQLSRNWRRW